MQVIVAGGGSVGTYVAAELTTAGHHVVVIEKDGERIGAVASAESAGQGTWVAGDACEPAHLLRCGIETADVLIAVTGDDEDNLVISLLAKQEFGVDRVIARVNNPSNEWMFDERWGVDVSVSTPHLLTGLVQESVSVGTLVRLLSFEHGRVTLIETTLADDAPVCGLELGTVRFPRESSVVAIVRRDHVLMPSDDIVFAPGDEVLVLVAADGEADVRALLTSAP